MVEWLAGNRIRGTSAEKPVLGLQSPSVGGWKELARHTRTTQGIMDVSSIPLSRYYMVLTNVFDSAPAGNMRVYCNNDTGSTHADRGSQNGAGDFTEVSKTNGCYWGGNTIDEGFGVTYWSNLAGKEKLGISHFVDRSASGAGTAPDRSEAVLKWSDVSTAINRFNSPASWNFWDSGSEMIVLGWDPADTHTTNFWEELGTFTNGTTTTDLTITSKKYLWIQGYTKGNGDGTGWRPAIKVGNTTISSADYANRESINGGADGTYTSQGNMPMTSGGDTVGTFFNVFIINNASNEKLAMGWSVNSSVAGADTAPIRQEFAHKWAQTSSQIDKLQVHRAVGSDSGLDADTIVKCWGSN